MNDATADSFESKLTSDHLVYLRARLGMSQTEFGKQLGLSLRAYQDIEARTQPVRAAYALAAEMVALRAAVASGKPELAGLMGTRTALAFARLPGVAEPAQADQ